MEIVYLGHSSFKIKGLPAGRQGKTSLLTVGLSGIDIENSKKKLTGPGEYEIMGISFIGIASNEDKKNVIFVIEIDGLRICHLGNLNHKLTEFQLKTIGDIDVLLIPVAVETLDSKKAFEVVQQIEPYFIIPMGGNVEEFLKETGMATERMNKFNLKKEEIIDDQPAKVIVLDTK